MNKLQIKKELVAELEAELANYVGANWRQDALPSDYNHASLDNKIMFLSEAVATYEEDSE